MAVIPPVASVLPPFRGWGRRLRHYRRSPLIWLVTVSLITWPLALIARSTDVPTSVRLAVAAVGIAPECYWLLFWLTHRFRDQ